MPVHEWTDAQRAFLVEKKIQRAGFAQIHAEYAEDGATIHTTNATMDFLTNIFGDRLMSGRRRGGMDWPANSPDLSPCDFWLHGYLKVAELSIQ